MNLLFDIGHPGHVHLYRNLFKLLKERGHSLFVTVKDISIAKYLLSVYGISYCDIGQKKDSILQKAISQFIYNLKIISFIRKHKIMLGVGSSVTLAHASQLTKMKSIILDDDDDDVQPLFVKYAHPFCDSLLSPSVLTGKRKQKKTLFYNGLHELAYLHPNHFLPDIKVLKELQITEEQPFFVMRFNVFKAHHDANVYGLSLKQKLKLVDMLKPHGDIFITTEREIEPELERYKLPVSPEKMHSLLAFAKMFIGDSQTMTSEAAVLGVPAIRCNTLVGKISYLEEEEHKYGLTYGFHPNNFDGMLSKIDELLAMPNLEQEWQKRRERLLADKIDVTAFLVWFVENYPKSAKVMGDNPDYQNNFKNYTYKQDKIKPNVA